MRQGELHGRHPHLGHPVGHSLPWSVGLTLLVLLTPPVLHAEIRTVTAAGEHVLGEHDTKDDAIRLATEAAKREALEQVATYLESVTVSNDLDLSRDEIRTYTAGVVNVLDEHLTIAAEGNVVTFHIDLTAQIDTNDVAEAVKKLREHEEVRQELAALKAEVDQLQQDLEQANQAIATAAPTDDTKELVDRRTELMNQMQSNALVQQAWTEWIVGGPYAYPYGYGYPYGVSVPGLLAWAGRLHPNNPHVPIVNQIVIARTGAPLPPAPPVPPTPPGHAGSIPPHQQLVTPLQTPANAVIGSAPGSRGFRRLQSMLPQYGTGTKPPSSSMFIQTLPGSNTQPARPPASSPPVSNRRLQHFLSPPAYAFPPMTRGIPPPSLPPVARQLPTPSGSPPAHHIDPWTARGFSRLQHTYPGFAPRSAPPSSGSSRSSGTGGSRGGGGRR